MLYNLEDGQLVDFTGISDEDKHFTVVKFENNLNVEKQSLENLKLLLQLAKFKKKAEQEINARYEKFLLYDRKNRFTYEEKIYDLISLKYRKTDDTQVYFFTNDNKLHRLHGPAFIVFNGEKLLREEWWINGSLNRDEGSAVTLYCPDGSVNCVENYIKGVITKRRKFKLDGSEEINDF